VTRQATSRRRKRKKPQRVGAKRASGLRVRRPRAIAPRGAYHRALKALALMRSGKSLSAACKAEHIKPDTFRRYVGSAIRHDKPSGRFRVAPADTLTRRLAVPTAEGEAHVTVRGIKAAREFSAHANAIAHFNRTGDKSRLKRFEGKTFRAGGRRHEFLTDPEQLMELAEADALRLDSLYASVSERR